MTESSGPRFDLVSLGESMLRFSVPTGRRLKDARQLSLGCVRLEDAARLGRWLLRRPLPRGTRAPEQRVDLPVPVPVYITYLTAMPDKGRVAFRNDVYARDGTGGNDRGPVRLSDAARP